MVLSVILSGHSICSRLEQFVRSGADARTSPSFHMERTAAVTFHGRGGKTIADFINSDMPRIKQERPDVLLLFLGDNDVSFDSSADEIAGRLYSLASHLVQARYVRHVVLCQLLPRFHAPRRLLRQYHGSARQRAEAHYLRMYNAQATEINRQLFEMSAVAPNCTFWNHNHKFKFGSSAHKFATDGIHLVQSAQINCTSQFVALFLQPPRDYTPRPVLLVTWVTAASVSRPVVASVSSRAALSPITLITPLSEIGYGISLCPLCVLCLSVTFLRLRCTGYCVGTFDAGTVPELRVNGCYIWPV